jgi:biofilm PGA synthesis lipoprotein PgaB
VRAADPGHFHAITYHDVTDQAGSDPYAVTTANLTQHFEWLRKEGYSVVGLDEILAAANGGPALPQKAVLLTFDDGMRSVYTRAFPLLKLYGYRSVVSVVTGWVGAEQPIAYDERTLAAEDFLTWEQLREMQRSGLVEIASHTHAMHSGVPGNPLGNLQPAAATRIFSNGGYEDDAAFMLRIEDDLLRSATVIREQTGRAPRAVTWPYGTWTDSGRQTAARLGMTLSLGLGTSRLDNGRYGVLIGRDMAMSNPSVAQFAAMFASSSHATAIRAARVELDSIYDPDVLQREQRLGAVLEAVRLHGLTHVLLTAYSDTDHDGRADSLYFPNSELPVRADLFNRAAWQLTKRSGMQVIASLPLTAYSAGWMHDTERRHRAIRDIYADLSRHASFHGLHFADGAIPRDDDLALSAELAATVRRERPQILTMRSWSLAPAAGHESRLDAYTMQYDYVMVAAHPLPDGAPAARELCSRLMPLTADRPATMQRLIAMLPGHANAPGVPTGAVLGPLAGCGLRHFAWQGEIQPGAPKAYDQTRQLISAADTPGSR